jgi:glycolate oxidase FAD binding subunit
MTVAVIESVSALRDRVLDAAQRKGTLRIVGQGTWLDAGRPARCSETVSVRELSGITQYVPGDLTLTARAGTTLAEIRDATSAHGQWLALDPHGADHGTLGATVATASTGPLTAAFGAPRDLVLGVEFVLGTGVVARGGGRVVKNVAGFDLTRLLTGSWGTLGILTEITVRLHALPAVDESFAIPLDAAGAAGRVRRTLRRLPFAPYACEVINGRLAALLVGSAKPTGLFRLAGNPDAVRAQRAALAELGEAREIECDVWQRLRQSEPDRAVVFRMSRASSDVDRTWSEAAALTASCPGALLAASPARGVVRCVIPASDQASQTLHRAFSRASGATCIGERLPAELWPVMARVPADPISAGIKRTFDPYGVLNAGVLFGDES